MRRLVFATALLWALGACAATRGPVVSVEDARPVLSPSEQAWRNTIASTDEAMLEALPSIWTDALAGAEKRSARDVEAEGALLEPGAALEHPELPPGSYWCRVVRVGKIAGRDRFRSFPKHFCYVADEDEGLSFTKQSGSDLPAGYLFAEGDRRYVFLGARQKAPGDVSLGYGVDPDRDVAGVVERVGPFRWRLVAPRGGGKGLDVYELTPVPADQQPS